jgi:hypothetical protein
MGSRMINISDIVSDDDFIEKCQKLVFKEIVDENGRPQFTLKKSSIRAVITTPKDSDMVRYVDRTTYTKAIRITTTAVLNPPLLNQQPDEIFWKGDYYVVDAVSDYSSFGYNRAICSLIQYQQSRIHQVTIEL